MCVCCAQVYHDERGRHPRVGGQLRERALQGPHQGYGNMQIHMYLPIIYVKDMLDGIGFEARYESGFEAGWLALYCVDPHRP